MKKDEFYESVTERESQIYFQVYGMVLLARYAGMQIGEIVRLTWDRVNLGKGRMGFVRVRDGTPSVERVVTLTRELKTFLRDRRSDGVRDDGRVFGISMSTARRYLNKSAEGGGLPRDSFKEFWVDYWVSQ